MPYDDINKEVNNDDGDYTLESILAEYKGSAFINGSSRLSKDELEKQAEKIISEYLNGSDEKSEEEHEQIEPAESGDLAADIEKKLKTDKKSIEPERAKKSDKRYNKPRRGEVIKKAPSDDKRGKKHSAKLGIEKGIRDVEQKLKRVSEVEEKQAKMFSYRELSEDEQEFFGVGKYSVQPSEDEIDEVKEAIETERKNVERRRDRADVRKEKGKKRTGDKSNKKVRERRELAPSDAVRVYGYGIESIRLRLIPLFIICAIMAYVTYGGDVKLAMPEFLKNTFGRNIFLAAGLIMSIMLAGEVFFAGLFNPLRKKIGAETLCSALCIFSLLDALIPLIIKDMDYGTPFCAVASAALIFYLFGILKGRKAFNLTFKIAAQAKVPTVISADFEKVDQGSVITKNIDSSKGFVSKSTESDISEMVYGKAAPLLILASIILSAVCSGKIGSMKAFIHCLSGLAAVSASFSALLIFNQPFFAAAKKLFSHGAAIAGWRGGCEMKSAVGMVVKDLDVFPENTMTLGGIKIIAPISEERIISYTASLVIASGAGTSKIFAELMREYSSSLYRVDEFSYYEGGGIGAEINGSSVLVGTAAFMTLMGIHMPPNLDIKSATFSAIDNELAAIFIINYSPSESVQSSLVNMYHAKITPIFAIRDVNVTPSLIKSKFKIPLDEGEFTSYAARYELSQKGGDEMRSPAAIMSREGINHYIETVSCGRKLVSTVRRALIMALAGTLIGIILMCLMLSQGAFTSASAGHVLTYMLMWSIASYLISAI